MDKKIYLISYYDDEQIIEYLSINDIIRLSYVNKYFNNICIPRMYKHITSAHNAKEIEYKIYSSLGSVATSYKNLYKTL